MTFREFYRWMIEFEPPDREKMEELLVRILAILAGRGQRRLPETKTPGPEPGEPKTERRNTHRNREKWE